MRKSKIPVGTDDVSLNITSEKGHGKAVKLTLSCPLDYQSELDEARDYFHQTDTKITISYIANQFDSKIQDNEVWSIDFNLYICAIDKKNTNDTAVYDVNVSHSNNTDLHFVLAHIENDILFRSIVPRNALSQSMSVHWARNKVKIRIEGGLQITINQLDRNTAQIEIPISVVQQYIYRDITAEEYYGPKSFVECHHV